MTSSKRLDNNEQVFCLVAECDEKLVGLAHYICHRNTIMIENTCYLQDLFCNAEMRGLGIGQKLVRAFNERAKQSGARGVYWHTHESNEAARRLYDKVAVNTEFVVYRHALETKSN